MGRKNLKCIVPCGVADPPVRHELEMMPGDEEVRKVWKFVDNFIALNSFTNWNHSRMTQLFAFDCNTDSPTFL